MFNSIEKSQMQVTMKLVIDVVDIITVMKMN